MPALPPCVNRATIDLIHGFGCKLRQPVHQCSQLDESLQNVTAPRQFFRLIRNVHPPQFYFQKLKNQLVLSWTNAGFNLQSAASVSGTFTNIPGATSPYTNSLTAPRQFFRLISN